MTRYELLAPSGGRRGNIARRNKGLSSEQTLIWDHENYLQQVKRTADGVVLENYLLALTCA